MKRFDSVWDPDNIFKNPPNIAMFAPTRIAALQRNFTPEPGVVSSNLAAPTRLALDITRGVFRA
jgi:hypothetical protein